MTISRCDPKGARRMKIFMLGKDRAPLATELAELVRIYCISNLLGVMLVLSCHVGSKGGS